MKKIFNIIILSTLVLVTSCKKYLDINENPNAPVESTPQLVLSNALVATGSLTVNYNIYGGLVGGQLVNAGGFGGFGSPFTYSYANNENTGLWTNVFDNLNDYQYIINQSATQTGFEQFAAIANVMKAYDYQMLIDLYGDVPYTEALKGAQNVAPKYDKAQDVYQDLIKNIDAAIAVFNANPTAVKVLPTSDVVFAGDITKWKKFATSLKLRMLTRIQGVPALSGVVTTGFASIKASDIMTDDVLVQPGYATTDGKQNPSWNSIYVNAAGTLSGNGRQYIPAIYTFGFYNGTKLTDEGRGELMYRGFPNTPAGQLSSSTNPNAPTGNPAWYIGSPDYTDTQGLLKGSKAAQPLFLAAESYFLLAEANLKGQITGNAETNFDNGIKASYNYLNADATYNNQDHNLVTNADAVAYLAEYKAANPLVVNNNPTPYGYLVNLTGTAAQQLEAIITQKYLALNFIFGNEAWAEFRRTGYPRISGFAPETNFASPASTSTRADKLPVRLPYPDTEFQLNSQNVPTGLSNFTSPIFWDLN
jgi:hypothetical protein